MVTIYQRGGRTREGRGLKTENVKLKTGADAPGLTLPARFCFPSPAYSHVWNAGLGRLMLRLVGRPDESEVRRLGAQLYAGDPLADEVARWVLERGMSEAQPLILRALDEGIEQVPEAPESLRSLFAQVDEFPAWVDRDKLALASELVRRSGPLGGYVLRDLALIGGYQSSAINKPLVFTGALDGSAANRISETNNFWIDITRENGLERFAPGVRTAVRVRVMHALLRVRIQNNPAWRNEQWGLPINQADLVTTNLAFSVVFLSGLRMLGLQISRREAEAVMHLWRYIGYLLGINVELLPETEKAGIHLLYCLTIAQPGADEDSRALAAALLEEPLAAAYPVQPWKRAMRVRFHHGLSRYFQDRHACRALGIRPTPWVLVGPTLFAGVTLLELLRRVVPGLRGRYVAWGGRYQVWFNRKLQAGREATYTPVDSLRR